MATNAGDHFDCKAFIAKHRAGTLSKYQTRQVVYAQGDTASSVFYILSGTVEIAVSSEFGKEGVIAILGAGDFFGEGCLDGHLSQTSSIVTTSECEIARFDANLIVRALEDDSTFAHVFVKFLLERNEKLKADLVDHLFNSSEKRLARALLTLSNTGLEPRSDFIAIAINQETLARMVGTTRSRISTFMNKFRKLGYIEYNGRIKVHSTLLNVILRDEPTSDAAKPDGVMPVS